MFIVCSSWSICLSLVLIVSFYLKKYLILKKNILTTLKKGSLLVSEPFADDPYFSRAVVLLLSSDEHGAMGLVVNKPMRTLVKQLFPDGEFGEQIVYLGGPVESDRVFYLHNISFVDGVEEVVDGVYVGGDLDELMHVVRADDSFNIKFFMGYTGWYGGQLEHELDKEAWVLTSFDKRVIFSEKIDDVWSGVLRDQQSDYLTIWMNSPLDPHSN